MGNPKRFYDDGVHYVSPAPDTDRHPLRWLVKSFRVAEAKTNRRAETVEDAIGVAQHMTEQAIAKSAGDRALYEKHRTRALDTKKEAVKKTQPAQTSEAPADKTTVRERQRASKEAAKQEKLAEKERKRQERLALRTQQREDREARSRLERFATTHFNCIRANPVAQVWQCISDPAERKPVGRRKAGGRAPDQAPVRHTKGECAVLIGKEPLRDPTGRVEVFPNWQSAETRALELYATADEDDRIFWQEPEGKVVGRTIEVEIIFDPSVNGPSRPFNLWFYKHNKPYYRDPRLKTLVTAAKDANGNSYQPPNSDARAAHDFNRTIERIAQEDRKMLSMEVAKFRTIWEAEAEAMRLEREYFGNGEYY